MLIPIGTDRRLNRTPIVTPLLIAANVAVLLWCYLSYGTDEFGNLITRPLLGYMLAPVRPQWYQFITYQFLHDGWMHLLGNMIFLWVFGCAIEDRLGRIGFIAFYLAGGAMAGAGTLAFGTNAFTLGASGSIAAVSGAFLALAPLSRVMMTFAFIHYFELPAIWLIGMYFAWDLFGELSGAGRVAYMAHLSGYVVGFGVGLSLLKLRILQREMYDFLALLDRWNRRRQLRAATRDGASPWEGGPVRASDTTITERDASLIAAREAIHTAMAGERFDEAIDRYEKLLAEHDGAVLPRDAQFDLANYAMRHERYAIAARAHELFCASYDRDPRADESRLLAGLIYVRYLHQPDKARPHLEAAAAKLDGDRKALAESLLGEAAA